jgi:hypothetical protein
MDGSAQRSSRRYRKGRVDRAALLGHDWHPLDDMPAPEYIPSAWDGPHVGLRLADAFRTLSQMPSRSISAHSGYWPEYYYEWEDLLAQKTADVATQEDDASDRNRTKLHPSAKEISQMEMAICWPGRYIHDTSIAKVVQQVAFCRARDLDMQHVSRKLRLAHERVRIWNGQGLDLIAIGLRRHEVRVF